MIVIRSLRNNFTVIVSPLLTLIVIIFHLINYCPLLMSNSHLLIGPCGSDCFDWSDSTLNLKLS